MHHLVNANRQKRGTVVSVMSAQSDNRTAGSRIKRQIMIHGGSKTAATTGKRNLRRVRLRMGRAYPLHPAQARPDQLSTRTLSGMIVYPVN
jgi:hypothetical protein